MILAWMVQIIDYMSSELLNAFKYNHDEVDHKRFAPISANVVVDGALADAREGVNKISPQKKATNNFCE